LLQTIYEEPQAAFQADPEICFGDTLQLTDQSSATGAAISGWTWDFGDGTGSSQQNPKKVFTAPGRYTVTLSVVSDKGCSSVTRIATQEIEVMALPVADFAQLNTACVGREIQFLDNASTSSGTLVQWNWTLGNNGTAQSNQPGHVIGTIYNQVTDFIVGLQVKTDKGCISPIKRDTVTVHPNPVAAFEVGNICVNDQNAPFVDASTVSAGSIASWLWNFGDPNANAGNPNTASTAQAEHHYTLPGTYTSTLIAGSAAGCYDTTQRTFSVNGAVLTPAFVVDNNNTVCSNQELTIRDQSQIDAGRIVRVEIYWDPADPNAITIDESPFPGKQYSHRYPVFSSPASKQYRVRYMVYSGIDCVDSFEDIVTVLASPQITMATVPPLCSDAPSLFLSATVANGLAGTGIFSGPGTSGDGQFNPAEAGAGLQQLYYQFTAANGCSETDSISVTVHPTPVADAGPDKVVLEGGEVTLTPVLITDYPVTYTWSPSAGLNDSSIAQAKASPTMDMLYRLRIESEFGCGSTDEVMVKLLKMPVIPNIFSPNGDGINDRWEIPHLETYPGSVIQLFNRYGQLVHRIVNYSIPWDGKISGRDAPVGTYYYIIDPRNGRKPMTGFVDIIR
jgi:gliding motility-associated-like protein